MYILGTENLSIALCEPLASTCTILASEGMHSKRIRRSQRGAFSVDEGSVN